MAVRAQTEALAKPLTPEDCQLQSMPDASPTKWHLAHLTWFFETFVLEKYEADFEPFDARFRVLFNSYYDGVGNRHPRAERGLVSRPSLTEVMAYRQQVNERVLAVLAQASSTDSELNNIVTLGLHHEQQHQELILTDIKHALSRNPAQPAYAKRWPLSRIAPQPVRWHSYAGGLIEHGANDAHGNFVFDNETPRHKAYIAPFELASRPVTNGDWLAFMADNGYQRPELWLSMGWDWVQAGSKTMPMYWQREGGDYRNFTLHGSVAIDTNTPACHLSYFEADAFARWSKARLPTEFEWEFAASTLSNPVPHGHFVESAVFHPMAVQKADAVDPVQMFGDVWEWTQSNYNPYPAHQPWEGVAGEYNAKFMCNQFVLRGGSCATPLSHIRATYRNFFPPDACWQFSGLRLARDVN
jgi:ergothioneine biosynthesis protein EgtB